MRACERSSRRVGEAASSTLPSTPMARKMAASLASMSGMFRASEARAGHALSRRRKAPRASLPARRVSATARSSSPVSTPPLAARCASTETSPASPKSRTPPVSRKRRASAVSRCRSATASGSEDGVRARASRRPSTNPAFDASCSSTAGNSSSSSDRWRSASAPPRSDCVSPMGAEFSVSTFPPGVHSTIGERPSRLTNPPIPYTTCESFCAPMQSFRRGAPSGAEGPSQLCSRWCWRRR